MRVVRACRCRGPVCPRRRRRCRTPAPLMIGSRSPARWRPRWPPGPGRELGVGLAPAHPALVAATHALRGSHDRGGYDQCPDPGQPHPGGELATGQLQVPEHDQVRRVGTGQGEAASQHSIAAGSRNRNAGSPSPRLRAMCTSTGVRNATDVSRFRVAVYYRRAGPSQRTAGGRSRWPQQGEPRPLRTGRRHQRLGRSAGGPQPGRTVASPGRPPTPRPCGRAA